MGSGSSHPAERSQPGLTLPGESCHELAAGGPAPEPIHIIYANLYIPSTLCKPLGGVSCPDTQHAWCFLATEEHWRSPWALYSQSTAVHRRCPQPWHACSGWHRVGWHGTKGGLSDTAHEQCRDLGKASESPPSPGNASRAALNGKSLLAPGSCRAVKRSQTTDTALGTGTSKRKP